MKIREYIEETAKLGVRFETCTDPEERLSLLDAIMLREGDIHAWRFFGLTEDDEIPARATRVLFPSFELKA